MVFALVAPEVKGLRTADCMASACKDDACGELREVDTVMSSHAHLGAAALHFWRQSCRGRQQACADGALAADCMRSCTLVGGARSHRAGKVTAQPDHVRLRRAAYAHDSDP